MKVYLTGVEVLSPESPVNLCLESGPLQTKLFDPALLALPAAPVLCCRVHEQLWPIDRPHQSMEHNFHSVYLRVWGDEKAPALEIRTCHH